MMSDEEIDKEVLKIHKELRVWDGVIKYAYNEIDAIRLHNAFLEFFNSELEKEDENEWHIHVKYIKN